MSDKIFLRSTRRIAWLDLAKGIGIMLVVWAHARGPGMTYIYLFHMPMFFMISGYLYNAKDSWPRFVWKRICSLYIPFIFWNVLAHLIRYWTQYLPITWETTRTWIINTLLTMDKNSRIFGVSWFLGSLFLMAVVYKTLDVLLCWMPLRKWFFMLLFTVAACVSFVIPLPFALNRTLILSMFYAFGVLMKEHKDSWEKILHPSWGIVLGVVFFCIFVYFGKDHYSNMGKNDYSSPAFFVLSSFMMSYVILYGSYLVDKWIFKIGTLWKDHLVGRIIAGLLRGLEQITLWFGKNSMDMVLWQFLCFRVVTIIQILRWGNPFWETLLEHPTTYVTRGIWWFLYFLAGTFLSVLLGSFLRAGFWGKIFRKLHIV
ncbi:MAG: acyltransferase family protein [Eubacteriales bacterium]|nr:acyltransferase family protein [Eubacteriales bacterium]